MSTDKARDGRDAESEPAISVRGVGKRYDMYARNLDRVKHALTGRRYAKEFWALREVSFDVMRGEAVGIVGRNGGGKSTLMQIIAGTLAPTEGEVRIRGRISALLELGSGFNPAFTGRENVFLAGAILGVPRREMERRFDDVAAFADIGDFLEEPVELYSSGMHARLAFSVAICVQPDILIVDEILSVGDAGFQQKCVARMRQMLDSGVTLLFVSHSADMVKSICTRGLYLRKGRQEIFGTAVAAVDQYMQSLRLETTERAQQIIAHRRPELAAGSAGSDLTGSVSTAEESTPAGVAGAADRGDSVAGGGSGVGGGTGHGSIVRVRLLDEHGRESEAFNHGEPITVEAVVRAEIDLNRLDLVMVVRDRSGVDVFGSTAWDEDVRIKSLKAGEEAEVLFTFNNALQSGPHGICLSFVRRPDNRGEGLITLDHQVPAAAFESLASDRFVRGKVRLPLRVELRRLGRPGGVKA